MSANKTYIFDIEIRGTKQAATSVSELKKGLGQLKSELDKTEVGSEAFKKIEAEMGKVRAEIERLKPATKTLNANAKLDAAVPDSYKAWKAEIALLTTQLENLSEADAKGDVGQKSVTRIKELTDKTKQFEENLGRFQSNVGNYEKGLLKALGLSKIGERIDAVSQKFGSLGSVVAGAGVAGAVAAGVLKIGEAVGAMVKEFDDAKKTVEQFAGGTEQSTDKAAETLLALARASGQSTEELSKQAAEVAKKNSISFEEALERISGTMSVKQRQAFEENKKFAAAQNELSKSFARIMETIAPAIEVVKTGATKALTFLLDYWNGVASVYVRGYEKLKSIGTSILEFFERTISTVTGGLYGVSAAEQEIRRAQQDAAETEMRLTKTVEDFNEKSFARLKKGLGETYTALTDAQKKAFADRVAGATILGTEAGKDFGKALDDGFIEALAVLPANIRAQFDDNRKVLTEEQKKEQEEAKKQAEAEGKRRREEAKKQAEELQKDRAGYQKQRLESEADYARMLFDLTQQLYRVELEFIKNEKDKQVATETASFEQQRNSRREAYGKFIQDLVASEEQARKLYGEKSDEFQKVVDDNEMRRIATKKLYNDLDEAETKAHNERLLEIEKEAQAEQAAQRIEALNAELELFRDLYDQQEAAQTQADRKQLLQLRALGEDKAKIEIEQANQKLKATLTAEQKLTEEINRFERARAGLSGLSSEQRKQLEDEQAARLQAREALNNDIFEAEIELNEKVEAANKESAERRKKTLEDAVTGVLDFASKGISVFLDFQKSLADAEIKRLDEQKRGRERAVDDLKREKETQIGLEAEATQQKIDLETKALEDIEAKRKEIEEEQKKATRFKAIGESIINTAVAVTKALPNPILAATVGILGAIQTAAIIAQPLATGGIVGAYPALANGGVINKAPNASRSKAGDEILIYAKSGETVLTAPQTRNIGEDALARAGVPGFTARGNAQSDNSANPAMIAAAVTQTITPMLNKFVNERIEQIPVVITSKGIADANRNQLNIDSRRNL